MNDTALTITDDQTEFTPQQQAALQHMGVQNASHADAQIFLHQVQRTGLDPFAKQIYMIERQGKQTIQTGIDGFRLIANRATQATGESVGYEDTLWCGPDGQWTDVWVGQRPPVAAKVTVLRNNNRFPAIALFDEYAARKRNGDLTQMWMSRPAGQLAKCAEALALRKAFPQDLSGLYSADEMDQADNTPRQTQQPQAEPQLDPVDEQIQAAWDDQDRLRKVYKWLANHDPKDHRLAGIQQRGRELADTTETMTEPLDGELVEDNEETTT